MAPTMPSGHLVGDLFAAGVRTIRRDLVLARRYSLFWFAIACFDTLSLLPLERTFVWPAKLTLAKILFLVNWATTFAVDAIILSLTIFRSVQIDRRAGTVPIVRALWRDGLVYYFLITLTHVVSVGMAIQIGKPLLKALNTPASLVLTSLMASRLVLSLHVRAATASVTSGRPVCRRSRKLSVPDAETTNDSNLRMEQIKSAQQL
ncbi:hypothetical protein JCM16303_005418 [Sporobolomyces ruberrimus]